MMKKVLISILLVLAGVAVTLVIVTMAGPRNASATGPGQSAPTAAELDKLLAPIALYPDQLLAQMLQCAMDPAGVTALNKFLMENKVLKGSELQDAAVRSMFEPSFIAMALFPQVVEKMATDLESTRRIGEAFTADRSSVFNSIQRLRSQARQAGSLKTTPQQEVETQKTSSGEEVIVIEPTNPQVVYVPQYNPQVVYTQPSTTTVVVEDNSADAAAAGLIGFTAGIALGAAMDNDYYYGPYGWHGGGYMYNDAWNDYYDAREDAREDWQDHREDMYENRSDRLENTQEQRADRQENRQENRPETQQQRQERRSDVQATRSANGTSGQAATKVQQQRSGSTSSDAFSGYSSGKSTRSASSRGQQSRGGGGGSRGGGRRR